MLGWYISFRAWRTTGVCFRKWLKGAANLYLLSVLPSLRIGSQKLINKNTADAEMKHHQTDANVSPIHLINGDGAEYWLQANIATKLGFQDPDAR